MIRTLSLAAALAILPLSSAGAADPTAASSASEIALEAAAAQFEARMEAFGERAEVIADDETLSEDEREQRIAAVWAEYQPDVAVFTALATQHAGQIASEALADIDIEALVSEAMTDVDIEAEVERALAEADIESAIEQALEGLEDIEVEVRSDKD